MFLALLLFGGFINKAVHWATPHINDPAFLDLMKLLESIILYADLVFVTWWAVFSTYKAIKEMIGDE